MRRLYAIGDSDEEGVAKFCKAIDLKDCAYVLAEAWMGIGESILKNSWNKVRRHSNPALSPRRAEDTVGMEDFGYGIGEIAGLEQCHTGDVESWLGCDAEVEGFPLLDDGGIITEVLQTDESDVGINKEGDRDAAEDPGEEVRVPTSPFTAEVIQSSNLAHRWLES